jgi:uncharacterized protein YegP (UPF0339 family)
MPGKFELKQAKNGQVSFTLKASTGEVLLTSQRYTARKHAKKGIASVQKNAPESTRYVPHTSRKGEPYFVLRAGNHQPIGTSVKYASAKAMEQGIKSVQRTAPGARVEVLS